jgi:hypothetical protein
VDLSRIPDSWSPRVFLPWEKHNVKCYAYMGGSGRSGSDACAVMAFLDFKQIALDAEDRWETYASVPPGTAASIPGRFRPPMEPDVHRFLIVWAFRAYHLLEEPSRRRERTLTRFSDFVEPSIRVALVVNR